jgi:hypothetical protein
MRLATTNLSPATPAASEIAACRTRCTRALEVIRLCKAQPTEMSAGSKDYRAVHKVLTAAANNLDLISTKFTVTIDACLQQLESRAWAAALCKSVDTACAAVISSGTVAAACSCGRHLRNDLLTSVETTVSCVGKLVEMAEIRLGDPSNLALRKQLAVMTGQVTSACKTIALLPKSNKGCLKRRILGTFKQMKDIMNEQEEMINDSLESPREVSGEEEEEEKKEEAISTPSEGEKKGDFDDNDMFFDDYDFSLSLVEIETSRQCLTFAGKCTEYMKTIALLIGKHVSDRACTPKAVESIDNLGDLMSTFSEELNELGVCLCPPQKEKNVNDTMSTLRTIMNNMWHCLLQILEEAVSEDSNEEQRTTLLEEVSTQLQEMVSATE